MWCRALAADGSPAGSGSSTAPARRGAIKKPGGRSGPPASTLAAQPPGVRWRRARISRCRGRRWARPSAARRRRNEGGGGNASAVGAPGSGRDRGGAPAKDTRRSRGMSTVICPDAWIASSAVVIRNDARGRARLPRSAGADRGGPRPPPPRRRTAAAVRHPPGATRPQTARRRRARGTGRGSPVPARPAGWR